MTSAWTLSLEACTLQEMHPSLATRLMMHAEVLLFQGGSREEAMLQQQKPGCSSRQQIAGC